MISKLTGGSSEMWNATAHSFLEATPTDILINTPRQWGALTERRCNRFSGVFVIQTTHHTLKTAEAVRHLHPRAITLLKRGVNGTCAFREEK